MTPEQFNSWLAEMKKPSLAKTDKRCAELLGITPTALVTMKAKGANERTALACAALLQEIKPYGSTQLINGKGE